MKEIFDLMNAMRTFNFLFRLYNFVSQADQDNHTLRNPFDQVVKLNLKILGMGLDALTS